MVRLARAPQRRGLMSDDIKFKEFLTNNGRAFSTFWQIACPNHIFIEFYAELLKSQQNFESIVSLSYKCVTTVMAKYRAMHLNWKPEKRSTFVKQYAF